MFELAKSKTRVHIDLESVRETLLYIESDLRNAAGFETVAAAIGAVLGELDRVEEEQGKKSVFPAATGAQFLPAFL